MQAAAAPPFDWKRPDYGPVIAARGQRLELIEKLPEPDFVALMAYYKDHPDDWINDWGWTFDPRNATPHEDGTKLPTTLPFLLFQKQRDFVAWFYARWQNRQDGVCEKSRDMGVSWLCVGAAVHIWTFFTDAIFGFGSRKEDLVDKAGDSDSLFWKIRFFVSMLPPRMRPAGYNEDRHAKHMLIVNPANGAAIRGEAGDGIGRGGRATVYVKDESAHYEHAAAIDASLSQTTNCQIDVSTPNGEGNPFWQKRHGGKLPVFVFDWRDDPRKSQAWYENQKATKDAVTVAQEIDRDYGASISNSFIKSALVTAAMSKGPADVAPMGPLRVGLDVARYGDDKTCLMFRRGRVLVRMVTWGKTDLVSTAGRVKQEVNAFCSAKGTHLEQIAVDTTGMGAGVADMLRGWFLAEGLVVDVDSGNRLDDGHNFNLRAFAWSQMRDWLATAAMPNDQELRVDLTGIRYGYRAGALLLESKEEAKRRGVKSPDRADALAYTFAIPGGPKPKKRPPPGQVQSYEIDSYVGM
jgi:phage terminase large subunit